MIKGAEVTYAFLRLAGRNFRFSFKETLHVAFISGP